MTAALEALKRFPLAILSNGSPAMLDAAVLSNGLGSSVTEVISGDRAKAYKPSPRAYALGVGTLEALRRQKCFLCPRTGATSGEPKRLGTAFAGVTGPAKRPNAHRIWWSPGLDQIAVRLTG